ncbi:uncharacterized protein LOC131656277 [Vicia villosa]|uniref:uncharacterized protein LOC131656277 n=1 Tax=Vicia villosa TaxID=3911 RepID=UPI00273B650A|nr:uncharacterized protein LOC131656277 [Vicia villosa]
MSVLVNGSPTKEFVVERGLRQGDPLSPFLFVIVAEELKIMVNKAVVNGDFVGCFVNNKCFIDVLQFADGTLLVGDGSWKHLWAIKVVFRGFDMVSDLGINFNKSKLIGININSRFMEVATSFLACKREGEGLYFSRMLKARYDDIKLRMVVEGGRHDNYSSKFNVSVACMAAWIEGDWKWNDLGISHVPADLKTQEEALRVLLQHRCPTAANTASNDLLDRVVWLRQGHDSFSVSSCYSAIGIYSLKHGPPNRFDFVYPLIWKVEVPLKIKAFGGRCFKYRIPMKDLLLHRGIISPTSNLGCVFCDDSVESPLHLFLYFRKAGEVWKEMACWIGLSNYKEVNFKEFLEME